MKLKVYKETGAWPGFKGAKKAQAWSDKVDRKERKSLRREKKELKRKKPEREEEPEDAAVAQQDMKDLDDDYRLLKKMKRGKVISDTLLINLQR